MAWLVQQVKMAWWDQLAWLERQVKMAWWDQLVWLERQVKMAWLAQQVKMARWDQQARKEPMALPEHLILERLVVQLGPLILVEHYMIYK